MSLRLPSAGVFVDIIARSVCAVTIALALSSTAHAQVRTDRASDDGVWGRFGSDLAEQRSWYGCLGSDECGSVDLADL